MYVAIGHVLIEIFKHELSVWNTVYTVVNYTKYSDNTTMYNLMNIKRSYIVCDI
jgi:hypothetical protein